jgi:hypothetical protein
MATDGDGGPPTVRNTKMPRHADDPADIVVSIPAETITVHVDDLDDDLRHVEVGVSQATANQLASALVDELTAATAKAAPTEDDTESESDRVALDGGEADAE